MAELTPQQKLERKNLRGTEPVDDYVVAKVKDYGSGSFEISTDAGTGFGFPREHGVIPKIGDSITLYYVNGKWTMIRGMDLNGVPVYFKTAFELAVERELSAHKQKLKKEKEFEEAEAQLDADYAALPQVFKARIDRFRAAKSDFRVEYEAYEMFTCTEAVKMAEAARVAVDTHANDSEVEDFYASPTLLKLAAYGSSEVTVTEPANPYARWLVWAKAVHSKAYNYDGAKQKLLLGTASGHSGNTFEAAMFLARVYIEAPEFVAVQHGALVPLVGCEAYGCSHNE